MLTLFGGRGQTLGYAVEYTRIITLGAPSGVNQLAVTVVQIVMNNTLGHYGELSQYGQDIPLACVGIISKVSSIFNSVIFGISQSTQPIIGYNYGAGNYKRVKAAFAQAVKIVFAISIFAFLCFQLFPRPIISIFGNSMDPLCYEFAIKYFRIFLFCTFILGLQFLSAQFFPSIGKGGGDGGVPESPGIFLPAPGAGVSSDLGHRRRSVGGPHRGRGVRGDVAAPGSAGNAAVGFLTVLEKFRLAKRDGIFSF